jgi:hypothetical protein
MFGAGGSGAALSAQASNNRTAGLVVRNSVLTGYHEALRRSATAGSTANITTDYSDYTGPTTADSGPGSVTETNHLVAAPGFVGATDFHLRPDSPLIDAGDLAALGAGESATDASGQPRITDGNGDCTARRDVGAYVFQPGPRAPRATASATPSALLVGAGSSFDATGSCDPDGDSLTFAWAFDDGANATGATVQTRPVAQRRPRLPWSSPRRRHRRPSSPASRSRSRTYESRRRAPRP